MRTLQMFELAPRWQDTHSLKVRKVSILDLLRVTHYCPMKMQEATHVRQRAAGVASAAPTKPTAKAQWAFTATAGTREHYTDQEWQQLQAAKWEHAEATAAARRALQVVCETTQVAQQTLSSLYDQGQQIHRAAHGVEQIEENVQHAGRIVSFMRRMCCFRSDPDAERERRQQETVQRQRMDGVLVHQDIACSYALKKEAVAQAVLAKTASSESMAAAEEGQQQQAVPGVAVEGRQLIAAVPPGRHSSTSMLGYGLQVADRQQLQAESAVQDGYLDQISCAVDALQAMGLAMGQELDEQAVKLEELQQQAEQTGQGLRSVASGAAKLVGRAPNNRRSSASSWVGGEQDAAAASVARAVVATAPVAGRYKRR